MEKVLLSVFNPYFYDNVEYVSALDVKKLTFLTLWKLNVNIKMNVNTVSGIIITEWVSKEEI